jgi:hypothetical protein
LQQTGGEDQGMASALIHAPWSLIHAPTVSLFQKLEKLFYKATLTV